ncbi:MAG: divalent-cation tolerance protein CutA [Nitrospirae bacterium]|nr:divalent-cation tolerance protein CutA [Nitrospirota bacterium]
MDPFATPSPRSPIVVLMTFSSSEEASRIAAVLVEERLVACVNLVPAVRSFFVWDNALQDVQEVLGVAKTIRSRLDAVVSRVKSLHSYSVPEVIGLPILGGSESYLQWVLSEVFDE